MNIGRTWKQKGTTTCTKVRQIIPADIPEDTFALHRENQLKLHGEFKTEIKTIDFFKGYFVAATKGARMLSRALAKLSFPAHMVGAMSRGYQPISEDAQLLKRTMDKGHVVRLSLSETVLDVLRVQGDPLTGYEDRVTKFNRRRVWAFVCMGEGGGATATLSMPLAILAR